MVVVHSVRSVGESVIPAVALLVETAIHVCHLVEEELEIQLHSALGPLEAGIVGVGR